MELLCQIREVEKTFALPTGTNFQVLGGVSLEIRDQEVLAVLGPSGCGKSTLMRVLAGLIQPDAGQVLYHGKSLEGLNPGVAIVFQSFALYPWLTVQDNIGEALRARGFSAQEARVAVQKVVHLVGLTGFE